MKRILLLTFLLLFLFPAASLAHSGRTDSSGGHYDKSTGEYHYHHGYSAHQHPDGVCPYNKKQSDSYNNESDKQNDTNSNSYKKDNTLSEKNVKKYINLLLPIVISVIFAGMFLGIFFGILSIFEPLSFLKKPGEALTQFMVTIIWYFALLPFALLYLPFMLYDKIKNHFKK